VRSYVILFFLLVNLLFFHSRTLQAQQWELGGWMGTAHYFGDLNTNTSFKDTRPALGAIVRRNLNYYFSIRSSLNFGYVAFDDKLSPASYIYQKTRNLNFYSHILELSTQMEINFFKYKISDKEARFAPYFFVGLGCFFFSPKTELGNSRYNLANFSTEGQGLPGYDRKKYFPIQLAIPFGMGIKYGLSNYWTIGAEVGTRKTSTDYLDDVSSTYVNQNALLQSQGQDAVSLSDRSGTGFGTDGKQRGDSQKKDSYLFMGMTLTYTIRSIKCPYP